MAAGAPDPRQLQSVFQFTAEQLAANRAGTLAPGQLTETIKAAVFGSLFVLAVVGFGIVALRASRGIARIVGPIVLVIGCAIIVGVVVVPAARDLASETVAATEGKVDEIRTPGKGGKYANVVVGGVSISTRADPNLARSLVGDGTRFRVYYLPQGERLLSLEPTP
jgi:hypothetical protein